MNNTAAMRRKFNQLELALIPAGGATRPVLKPDDRLSLTFCLALIFHTLIILGIVFTPEDKANPRYEYMEIVLVQQTSEPEEDADVLAQANLRGGGEIADESIQASPLPALPDQDQPDIAPPAEAPAHEALTEPEMPDRASEQDAVEHVAAESQQAAAAAEENPDKPEAQQPSASELRSNSLKMAALSSEVQRKLETRAKRPKRRFISASTREYKYAAYMEAWRAKVERVGNLNYPEEARRRNISGQLVLDVALNPDGKINQITIRRSSGHKVLDDAAIKIVELAAPYAPFPEAIRAETDVLHITRTWQFLDQRGFR